MSRKSTYLEDRMLEDMRAHLVDSVSASYMGSKVTKSLNDMMQKYMQNKIVQAEVQIIESDNSMRSVKKKI